MPMPVLPPINPIHSACNRPRLGLGLLMTVSLGAAAGADPANPLDGNYHYVGRVLRETGAVVLTGSGMYVETKFSGTKFTAKFDDQNWGNAGSRLRFLVYNASNTLVKNVIGTVPNGATNHSISVTGLASATYRLQIVRESGQDFGALRFKGLTLDSGKTISDPGATIKTRKIEFYGDSVTAGVQAGSSTARGSSSPDSGYNSYANRLGRLYGATPWNDGISGLGVLNGKSFFGGASGGVGLESTYNKIVLVENDLRTYNFGSFKPQLVVMAMGINDVGTGVLPSSSDKARWNTKYKEIVRDIATKHQFSGQGGPVFLFTVPPLGSYSQDAKAGVQEVANQLKGEGYDAYFWAGYSQDLYDNTSDGSHPNAADHVKISDQLKSYIDGNLLGELQSRGW